MITNFDYETAPLCEKEIKAADIIGKCLINHHKGEENAVTSDAICNGLTMYEEFRVYKNGSEEFKPYVNGPRLRKIINYLRTEGGCPFIVSCSKGYYIAINISQIRDCIRSLRERASAITRVADMVEMQMKEVFKNNIYSQMEIK